MKIPLKHRYTAETLHETEAESYTDAIIKAVKDGAYLEVADLDWANLVGANLKGADLRGIKGYSTQHDIFFELIRREKIETIKKSEWEIIGKLSVHRFCWDTIRTLPVKPVLRILKMLAKKGYDEFLKAYKGEI